MSLRLVGLIYAKELRETLRDRRTLIVMVLLPLVMYPVVIFGLGQAIMMQQSVTVEQPSVVAVSGPAWPDLDDAFQTHKKLFAVRGHKVSHLASEEVDLLVAVPADYAKQLGADGTVDLRLTYDETRSTSKLALSRARGALEKLEGKLRTARLKQRSLPATFSDPLRLKTRSTAQPEEVGAHLLGQVLPLLAILMVLLGAFYPAIDLTAGEKERGTLETLLVTPVSRTALITGKFLVVATVATCTGLLNLGSLGLTVAMGLGPGLLEGASEALQVPWHAVALTAVAIVPAALFFSAVMVAVAALARSFKQAQNLLTPVYMLCMMPAMAAMFPWIKLTPVTALIPAVNVGLLARELIGGNLPLLPLVLCLVSCLAYTVAALRLAAHIYNSERMLFSPDPGRRVQGSARARLQQTPDPLQAAILMLGVLGLILLVGQLVQAMDIIVGLLITEWVLIATPVLLLLRFGRLDARAVLSLHTPRVVTVVGAVMAGLSGWVLVGMVVETVQQRFMPMPKELMEQMSKMLFSGERSMALDLFTLALSPAICEELLFRGVILKASRARMGVAAAVVLNGVLFGVFHLSIYRVFPTMILGMVLALIVIRTGSIIPAMVFHFLNNGCAVVAGRLLGEDAARDAAQRPVSAPMIVAALVLFVGGMALMSRGARAGPPGPSEQ